MRRIVGWILLTIYGGWLLFTGFLLFADVTDAFRAVPLIMATLPWSLLFLRVLGIPQGLNPCIYYGLLIVAGGINLTLILLAGGLGPFGKRRQTGTKET